MLLAGNVGTNAKAYASSVLQYIDALTALMQYQRYKHREITAIAVHSIMRYIEIMMPTNNMTVMDEIIKAVAI